MVQRMRVYRIVPDQKRVLIAFNSIYQSLGKKRKAYRDEFHCYSFPLNRSLACQKSILMGFKLTQNS